MATEFCLQAKGFGTVWINDESYDVASWVKNGWEIIGERPLVKTDAQALDVLARGYNVTIYTGDAFHPPLHLTCGADRREAAEKIRNYRTALWVYGKLLYNPRRIQTNTTDGE